MVKSVKTAELFNSVTPYLKNLFDECEYPWQILPRIKDCINELIKDERLGFSEISDGIYVDENVTISKTATLIPPVIIGSGTEIRPGAYIRGNVIIGKNCVIGNSSELKNCILLDYCQVPHYNYIGDSVLGNHSHMGAGAICSNLKADKSDIVIHADKDYVTGLRKIGAILGDNADIGCGCVLNPGTIVGKNTSVYPLTALRGVYPSDHIVKSANEIVKRRTDN